MLPIKDNIPLSRLPLVTIALVAVNVIVYLLEIRHGGSFFGGPTNAVEVHYGAIPYELTHAGTHCDLVYVRTAGGLAEAIGCKHGAFALDEPGLIGGAGPQLSAWQTAFTAMFLHASFLHIFGNMVFLAIFGPAIEDAMGRVRFTGFYLLGGLVALGAQVASAPNSTSPTLGASGAIAAVLGGYLLLYPRARVLSLVFIVFLVTIVEVPAVFLLAFWFAEQLWLGLEGLASAGSSGEGVAYFAHVGGFAFGLLSVRVLTRHVARPGGGPPLPPAAPPPPPAWSA
jgi:membrane associated rhomboid family serine protease